MGGGLNYNDSVPVKEIAARQRISRQKLERAKQFRRETTPAEALLWHELRGNKLGTHFRRQQIIAGFMADFYCHNAALVIEVDGGVHRSREQWQTDLSRDKVLVQMGLRVVRFRNQEVVNDLPRVLDRIRALIGP